MAGLARYIVRRVLFMIPVLLGVSVITFWIGSAVGNPVDLIRIGNPRINALTIQALKQYYHLDQPIYVQYLFWLGNFIRGNLGQSLAGGSVADNIGAWTLTTLELQILAILLSLAIGIPVGIFSALRQYSKLDAAVTTTSIFGVSMPTFWMGLVSIVIFSRFLRWLPAGGVAGISFYWWGSPFLDHIAHLILPVAVLTYVSLALNVRLIRANMLEVLRQDYILAARASGLNERKVVYRHALKNAISPVVTFIGLSFGLALSGAPLTETVFSWPGLGYRFVVAALSLDLPVVQGITVVIAITAVAANLITDLAYGLLDPRIRIS